MSFFSDHVVLTLTLLLTERPSIDCSQQVDQGLQFRRSAGESLPSLIEFTGCKNLAAAGGDEQSFDTRLTNELEMLELLVIALLCRRNVSQEKNNFAFAVIDLWRN